ncbi:hypothetical protein LA080_013529 [Diaporthe eres]|uniref:Fungal calcium binding protein domain-containing protein n=1 Tax=Diaporthe vaccinii TaxID=105482 RepID=A0ABR4F9X0_9PEZI|nr:hypothetical protein LA080_013529 [Diaporthe eres]
MRFATIVTALSAVAATGVISATVAQPKVGVATDGNVTATVEMVKHDDGTEVARITYTTVDVDQPDKLAPPVSRLCWNIGQCLAALSPIFVVCATAAASFGMNFAADAACAAAAANAGINLPKPCDGCF